MLKKAFFVMLMVGVLVSGTAQLVSAETNWECWSFCGSLLDDCMAQNPYPNNCSLEFSRCMSACENAPGGGF